MSLLALATLRSQVFTAEVKGQHSHTHTNLGAPCWSTVDYNFRNHFHTMWSLLMSLTDSDTGGAVPWTCVSTKKKVLKYQGPPSSPPPPLPPPNWAFAVRHSWDISVERRWRQLRLKMLQKTLIPRCLGVNDVQSCSRVLSFLCYKVQCLMSIISIIINLWT